MTKNSILNVECQPNVLMSFHFEKGRVENETTMKTLAYIWCLVISF